MDLTVLSAKLWMFHLMALNHFPKTLCSFPFHYHNNSRLLKRKQCLQWSHVVVLLIKRNSKHFVKKIKRFFALTAYWVTNTRAMKLSQFRKRLRNRECFYWKKLQWHRKLKRNWDILTLISRNTYRKCTSKLKRIALKYLKYTTNFASSSLNESSSRRNKSLIL